MKKIAILSCLFFSLSLCLLFAQPGKAVKIIMNDSTVIKGEIVGMSADELFVEKDGKAVTLKRKNVKNVFDAETGEQIEAPDKMVKKAEQPAAKDALKKGAEKMDAQRAAGSEKTAPGGRASEFTEAFVYASMSNSFAIGDPLKEWMRDDMASGSPAFFNVGGTMYMNIDEIGENYIGVGFSLYIPPSHSIWGSTLYYGGRNELVLDPNIFSLNLPFRHRFKNSDLSVTIEAALLITILGGYYSTVDGVLVDTTLVTGTMETNIGSMGMGMGLSAGAEYYFGFFGLGAKLGYRFLNSGLNFDSEAGPWSPQLDGDAVGIDLSGVYMTVGALIKFGE